jgi:hypothetical protein
MGGGHGRSWSSMGAHGSSQERGRRRGRRGGAGGGLGRGQLGGRRQWRHGGRGRKGEALPLRCLLYGDCSVRACVMEAGNRRKEKRRKERKKGKKYGKISELENF